MRQALMVVTGLLLAFLAGLVTLVLLLGAAAATLHPATSRDVVDAAAWIGLALAGNGVRLLWAATVTVCLGPVAVVGLMGAVARLGSPVWYAGATGAVTAALPTLTRAFLETAPGLGAGAAEGRITLLLFLTGVAAGSVFWLVAGRLATRP